jgi:hypothetical protein
MTKADTIADVQQLRHRLYRKRRGAKYRPRVDEIIALGDGRFKVRLFNLPLQQAPLDSILNPDYNVVQFGRDTTGGYIVAERIDNG